jgi:hypothetical protein
MGSPRSSEQRKSDALAMLEALHGDLWMASAPPTGTAHLVPLSYAWDGEHIIIATDASAVSIRNIVATGHARLALGGTRDVVMIDATPSTMAVVADAPAEIAEKYADQADWDPRAVGGDLVFVLLHPERVQVWRESDEIKGRTIMRQGAWLV